MQEQKTNIELFCHNYNGTVEEDLIQHINELDPKSGAYMCVYPQGGEPSTIQSQCPNFNFEIPPERNGKTTKRENLMQLVREKENVIISYAMFDTCELESELAKLIKCSGYTLIMAEDRILMSALPMSECDVDMYCSCRTTVNQDGLVLLDSSAPLSSHFKKIDVLARNYRVYKHKKGMLSVFNIHLFKQFLQVHVLLKHLKHSVVPCICDLCNAEYTIHNPKVRETIWWHKLVSISKSKKLYLSNAEMSGVLEPYSGTAVQKRTRCAELRRKLRHFVVRIGKVDYRDLMWTSHTHMKSALSIRYAKENYETTHGVIVHPEKKVIAYLNDRIYSASVMKFLEDKGIRTFPNLYVLNNVLQFIQRSAAHNGEPIKIFVADNLTRNVLQDFINTSHESVVAIEEAQRKDTNNERRRQRRSQTHRVHTQSLLQSTTRKTTYSTSKTKSRVGFPTTQKSTTIKEETNE